MKKRCFALLLALILCLQLVPSVAAAPDAKNNDVRLNPAAITGGTATIISADGTTPDENGYYHTPRGTYDASKALTATANPDEGYEFSGWTVQQSANGTSWTNVSNVAGILSLGPNMTAKSNPISF